LDVNDRRRVPRQRSYLGARIAFNHRFSTFDCIARNLTGEGARLAFPNTVLLPEVFDLAIAQKGLETQVRVVWRTASEIGVRFVGTADAASGTNVVPIALARRLQDCERERDALRRRLDDGAIG
jgi:hypothetical protein